MPDLIRTTLLLRIILLSAHLFSVGNVRALRAFICYELWRHNLSGPHYLPVVKVFDANRLAIIKSNIDLSRARAQTEFTQAIYESMPLTLRFLIMCVRRLEAGNDARRLNHAS